MASRLSTLVASAEADDKDPLDDYIEAHVHGIVDLTRDAEALVLDPCYLGTPTELAARRLACPIEWRGGFTLTTAELRRHPGYRGQEFGTSACHSPATAGFIPGSSAKNPAPASTTNKPSNGSGITWQDRAAPRCAPDPFLIRFTHTLAEITSMDLNAYVSSAPCREVYVWQR